MAHIVLSQEDKTLLHEARNLRAKLGCPAKENALCWCDGQCKSPLVLALNEFIEELETKGRVPNYCGG